MGENYEVPLEDFDKTFEANNAWLRGHLEARRTDRSDKVEAGLAELGLQALDLVAASKSSDAETFDDVVIGAFRLREVLLWRYDWDRAQLEVPANPMFHVAAKI